MISNTYHVALPISNANAAMPVIRFGSIIGLGKCWVKTRGTKGLKDLSTS
jgi:hypothetical protein